MSEERPKLVLPYSYTEVILEVVAFSGLVFPAANLYRLWNYLPASVPRHFNAAGEPDAWGGRSILLVLPCMSLALYLLTTMLRRFPEKHNYPVTVTARNARDLYRISISLLAWIKAEMTWILGYLSWQTTLVALGRAGGLGSFFLPLTLGVVFATIGLHLWRMYRAV